MLSEAPANFLSDQQDSGLKGVALRLLPYFKVRHFL
jgi:hypothetical protein